MNDTKLEREGKSAGETRGLVENREQDKARRRKETKGKGENEAEWANAERRKRKRGKALVVQQKQCEQNLLSVLTLAQLVDSSISILGFRTFSLSFEE